MPDTMQSAGFFVLLRFLWRLVVDTFWQYMGALFDAARHMSPLMAVGTLLGLCALVFGTAGLMQARLNGKLRKKPKEPVSIWRQELMFSLPGASIAIAALPVTLGILMTRALGRLAESIFRRADKKDGEDDKKKEEDVSVVVASLGPSFMWSACITVGIFALVRTTQPLLRGQLGLSDGAAPWPYLFMGKRPEMQWYLPLDRFPYLNFLATIAVWMLLWWTIARVVRVVLSQNLGQNLADFIQANDTLASWRTWFGARLLFEPDASYKVWAKWVLVVALPFFVWAFAMVPADPYRTDASFFSVSLVLWLAWAIHLNLKGHWHMAEPEVEPEPEPEPVPGKGWPEVLDDLRTRLQVDEPYTFEPPRRVEPLQIAQRAGDDGLISPLLAEIYPGNPDDGARGLTTMQQTVLQTLSRQAWVHLDPPAAPTTLALGRISGAAMEDDTGQRHRNQVVLAPDGSGKTTLAMLAACNHALTHTRATLVITRDEASAEAFTELLRATLEPSTLRWTVRAKLASAGLIADFSQGIIPDVIVASLEQLVTIILAEADTFEPFLKTLGLIIVDDVDAFCGPVEIHTQLAFRRLTLRVREILGTRQLGEESAPVTLILGTDSMHYTPTWVKALCGVDAITRTWDYGWGKADAPAHGSGMGALTDADPGRYQLFYQLSDFATRTGDRLALLDIIESCERLGIAWHYRRAGDLERRHGRRNLKLVQEPQHYVDAPNDACVVFLEGYISEVRREITHLTRAGLNYQPVPGEPAGDVVVPIAFISLVDPDERMALTELNPNSPLVDIVRTLPRPIVRAPFGLAVESHLAADLCAHWIEVADVLEVFGNTAVHTLSRLAEAGLLLSESRINLTPSQTDYERQLHVRAPLKAVKDPDAPDDPNTRHLLPAQVDQVERPPGGAVAVRDRTNLTILAHTDRTSARHIYYPGRIFESAQGRYVVVGSARDDVKTAANQSPISEHDILVEPFLNDEVSSPRRRVFVRPMTPQERLPGAVAALGENTRGSEGDVPAEPVFIGDFPIAFSLGPVICQPRHVATFRLDAHTFQVRQRILFDAQPHDVAEPYTLGTVALGIFPNPALDIVQHPDCPRLQVRDARLLGATMRALLPSIYRGSQSDIQVALHILGEDVRPEQELRHDEGFYLYDPHLGGNGSAHAIHRDGVELLLRLCRVYLERVLSHTRLRARYDHWADFEELHAGMRRPIAGSDEPLTPRERDQQARTRVLAWLDSRLRPEGSAGGGRQLANFGPGLEKGEGDYFDLGRCWYSADGSVANLIWTKHRWALDEPVKALDDTHWISEAMCDVGIGREIAARARAYRADTPRIAEHMAWLEKQLQNPAFRQEDETIWGSPNTIWSLDGGEDTPVGSNAEWLKDEAVQQRHRLILGVLCDNYPSLQPLADLLARRSRVEFVDDKPVVDGDAAQGRYQLARFIADFVQGIPFAAQDEPNQVFGPIHTLLYRLGNQQSQSLLLAILLRHAGIEAGLFLHPPTGQMLCAAALTTNPGTEGIIAWRERFAQPDQRLIWGELPPQPGATTKSLQAFFPIETARYLPLAQADVRAPEDWVFLPLNAAWLRLGVEKAEIPGINS